jgi:hypothetical protein
MINPPIRFWMPEPIFMKLRTYITAPEPISMVYFISPSSHSVSLYVYPDMVARQWLGMHVPKATKNCLRRRFLCGPCYIKRKWAISSSHKLLFLLISLNIHHKEKCLYKSCRPQRGAHLYPLFFFWDKYKVRFGHCVHFGDSNYKLNLRDKFQHSSAKFHRNMFLFRSWKIRGGDTHTHTRHPHHSFIFVQLPYNQVRAVTESIGLQTDSVWQWCYLRTKTNLESHWVQTPHSKRNRGVEAKHLSM